MSDQQPPFIKTRYSRAVYEDFAAMVKTLTRLDRESGGTTHQVVDLDELVVRIAAIFAHDNARFRPQTFFEACGLGGGAK